MRDGTRLAVDLYLPRGLTPETKIPAIFAATRYWRAQQLKAPFSWFLSLPDSARNFFTAFGYAILRIDMRGTGASEGNHPHPWSATDLTAFLNHPSGWAGIGPVMKPTRLRLRTFCSSSS